MEDAGRPAQETEEPTREQHAEYREAIEASKIRSSMSGEDRVRLKEIRTHAEKLQKGRRNDPKEGSWLGLDSGEVARHSATMRVKPQRLWMNNVYNVQGYDLDAGGQEMTALAVQRHDSNKIRDHWELLQRIKVQLLGDLLGVELYPEKARSVNTGGIYMIWVFLTPTELPFGLHLPGYCIPAAKPQDEQEGETDGGE